ncbi:uncharacterized protein F5147DRAFT_660657 [Suillus discolor]|uniref:Uncharacterized protein n=1 Tax=Suillus discolor TaxID=1912936 RepID=A0A9P7JL61_9AGAM|nr:uncharacterized protein F5147DRAFT_660657 [Suillus discolor]KAG2081918.1 hypothetical protein F5147DRAFT_660657 [Suillus discolor]
MPTTTSAAEEDALCGEELTHDAVCIAKEVEQMLEGSASMVSDGGDTRRGWKCVLKDCLFITPSATVLWDYAQEIVQHNMEYAHTHPHMPHPTHPPIQMSRRDECLLALMVEDRREAVIRLWQELNEIKHLLGLEHI